MKPEALLFALLRNVVCGQPLDERIKECCTEEMLAAVYTLARKHDLAHLAAHALEKWDLPNSKPLENLQAAKKQAIIRYVRQDYECGRICAVLEKGGISHIPLKGAAIRTVYPEPWMRTSCDIDILIHEEDLEKAVEMLVDSLSYVTDHKKDYHDMSLFSPGGVHLELHFNIREDMDHLDQLLSRVWEHAVPAAGFRYELEESFLLFHLLAHMSYHFVGGGCGIRPFMDIFLLRNKHIGNERVLWQYLDQCGIAQFYENVLTLIDVWFGGCVHTGITERMQQYLLRGGVYGSLEQRIAVQQKRKGGKIGYLLNRVFLPYRHLKYRYRILERYPFLYPLMLVRRWIELLFSGKMERSIMEFETNRRTARKDVDAINDLMTDLGL